MNIFDWYEVRETEMMSEPNCPPEVEMMFEQFAMSWAEDDPRATRRYLETAKALAEKLGDEVMSLWADLWIQKTLSDIGELDKSYDLLVHVALESRESKYSFTPMGIMSNNLLASRLAEKDPYGMRKEIEAACAHLRESCQPRSDHACVFLSTMIRCHASLGEYEQAQALMAQRRLAAEAQLFESGWFYMAGYHLAEAHLAYRQCQWDNVLSNADAALSGNVEESPTRTALLALRAAALVHLGDETTAGVAYRSVMKFTDLELIRECYDGLAEYWLAQGNQTEAIKVREAQQEACAGKGRCWEQACGALDLIELFEATGDQQAAANWTEKLRNICADLKQPWHPQFAERL